MKAPIFFFSVITFCLFLQLNPSLSAVDPQFEACINKSCGHQSISFPFYIDGHQPPYCGYPGFAITCSDDRPLLNLSNTNYHIHDVVYPTRSLRVSNAAVSDPASLCSTSPASLRNLTLNPVLFQFYPNVTTLYLLYNCRLNSSSSVDLGRYGIGCSGGEDDGVLGLTKGDSGEGDAFRACDSVVEVPVEARENGSRREIGDIIGDGFVMTWTASNCSRCEKSGGRCGFDRQNFHFRCFCPDRPHACCCNSKGHNKWMQIGLGVGIGLAVILLVVLSIYMFRHRRKYKSSLSQNSSAEDSFGGSNVYFEVPIFSNDELEQATNNFDSSKELGDGGYGTVYYGKLKDGREVAVKRLYEHNYRRVKQFMTEVQILTRLRHTNLVSLYGCTSRRSRELLLVYEYVANGTVADHLHGDRAKPGSFPWPLRMNIAVETAKALAYLHKEGIIHRDVKTTNILLDKNFSVKVGDFGISRLRPTDVTHVSTAPQGTPGYVDPEYHLCYQLTEKSDVYSFGVVLVELVSSMPAVDISRDRHEINLANLAVNKIQKRALDELIDPNLNCESDDKVKSMVTAVIELSFRCLQQDRELRPTMDEVVEELENAVERGRVAKCRDPISRSSVSVDAGKAKTTGFLTSPESDEAALLNKVKFSSSPISVIKQNWTSSSSSINSSKTTLSTL